MEKIIVGCHAGKIAEIEAHLREMNMHEKVELVVVEEKPPVIEELKESIYLLESISVRTLFTPKVKHQPKGHERKYKYHR